MALMAGLESAERAHGEIQAMQFKGIMHGMAEYLGKSPDELVQDYVRRGLRSDLIRFLRSEGKPARRPLPVKILEGYEDDLGLTAP